MKFKTLGDALSFAIENEESSFELYNSLVARVEGTPGKQMLRELADTELGHKRMLENALALGDLDVIRGKSDIRDIAFNYIAADRINPQSDPQQILLYAIRREMETFEQYNILYGNYSGTELEALFARLAREELHHREILEEAYEKHFMQWM